MARTKGSKNKKEDEVVVVHSAVAEVIPTGIQPLSVDYTNEGLNDIARKINEIIEHING